MPERFLSVIESIHQCLTFDYCATRLADGQLDPYRELSVSVGWEFAFHGILAPKMRLLVDRDFPYSSPRVAVWPIPEVLTWPHVDRHGVLCIWESQVRWNLDDPVAVVRLLVEDTRTLVSQIIAGHRQEDFVEELLSYWILGVEPHPRFVSVCEIAPVAKQVHFCKVGDALYFGDTREALMSYLANLSLSPTGSLRTTAQFHLTAAPLPGQYPKDLQGLRRLIPRTAQNLGLLRGIITASGTDTVPILLTADTPRGTTLLAVEVQTLRGSALSGRKVRKGFRSIETTPPPVVLARLAPLPVERKFVQRADRSWIFGRDTNVDELDLRRKTVLLVGLGSLGSAVARLLGLAGVGRLILVDDDLLADENVSRHELGASQVGQRKASAVAKRLKEHIPHLVVSPVDTSWNTFLHDFERTEPIADLILDLTGSWVVLRSMVDRVSQGQLCPAVMTAWMEPFAVAGRTILVGAGDSLWKYFTATGEDFCPAVRWPNGFKPELTPSCGGAFSPYGATEMTFVAALVAQEVSRFLLAGIKEPRQRYWVTSLARISELGGTWNPELEALVGPIGAGARILEC